MDTSQKYIDMCREAKEIQSLWQNRRGDYLWDNQYGYIVFLRQDNSKNNVGDILNLLEANYTWLPKQDQFQEMLWNKSSLHAIIKNLSGKFLVGDEWEYWTKFKTFEQLWIALVMKESYKKEWNDKEWVKK